MRLGAVCAVGGKVMAWSDLCLWGSSSDFGYDEQQANLEKQKRRLAEQVEKHEKAGDWSDGFLNRQKEALAVELEDQNAAAVAGFKEGWRDGRENVKNAIGGAISNTVRTVTEIIPWQVWMVAFVVLLLWLGGGVWLVKKAKGVLVK